MAKYPVPRLSPGPTTPTKVKVKKNPVDFVSDTLREALNSFKGGKTINGGLGVKSGHEYWWFLEFGTSTGFTSEGMEEFRVPARIKGTAGGAVMAFEGEHGVRIGYPIIPRRAKILFFKHKGQWVKTKFVVHPGIQSLETKNARGFLRAALHYQRQRLGDELKRLAAHKKPPTREQLVDLVNRQLDFLLHRIQRATPRQRVNTSGHKYGGHLEDAWFIIKAQ